MSGGGLNDKSVKIWNLTNSNSIDTFETESQVCSLAFCGHSNQFVSTHGYPGNEIIVWNANKKEKIVKLNGHSNRVLHLAVEPDGENIATASGDETLKFWTVFPQLSNKIEEKTRKDTVEAFQLSFR